ncbi:MAG: RNA polymerase sigma factor [Bacillota bacterium]
MVEITDVFTTNYKLLFRIVYSYTGNIEDTKDILQDTFVKAYKSSSSHISPDKLLPWLIVIAKNTSLTHTKRQRFSQPIGDQDTLFTYEPNLLEFSMYHALEGILRIAPEDIRIPLKEHLVDEIPLKKVARMHALQYTRVRYWKKKIVSYMKAIL